MLKYNQIDIYLSGCANAKDAPYLGHEVDGAMLGINPSAITAYPCSNKKKKKKKKKDHRLFGLLVIHYSHTHHCLK